MTSESSFDARRMVVRERLLEPLRALRPLTLVSAPAGYGKTALVNSFAAAARSSHTVVRVDLHQDAIDARPFWASLQGSLARSGIDLPGATMWNAEGEDLRPLVRRIVAHEQGVALILDTGEFSLSHSVGAGLDWVIRRCLGKLSVILLTRIDPPLPLSRYR